MTFDPDDFQDQAAIAAMLQRQRMINSQNQQQSIPKNRQCPWCGGLLPGQFDKCQHCSSKVSWVAGHPCKPQDADYIRGQIEKESKEKAKLVAAIKERVVNCKGCGCHVPQSDLYVTIKRCEKCDWRFKIVYQCSIIAFLVLLAILIYN